MTALMIWSFLPGLLAFGLYAARRWVKAVYLVGVAAALFLGWLAWQAPTGEPIPLRLWAGMPALRINPEHVLFGSRFVISNSMRPALALLYLGAAFWFGGAGAAGTHRLFVPLGLAIVGLISAALAAESLPAAALLIALAALASIPIISSPGEPGRRGAMRFLTYFIGGTCLVVFGDASLTNALASPLESVRADLTPILLMLALGFALILAVAPFHTWMPMLGEETSPYAAAYIFYLLPIAVAFLALEALGRYSVAGLTPAMFTVLKYAGALMVAAGGIGAALEHHLGRTLGFAATASIGMTLLALSLNDQLGRATPLVGIFFAQMAPQGLGLAVWGLALTVLRAYMPGLSYPHVRGALRCVPAAACVVVLANLSIAGLPLLAGFPVHLALLSVIAREMPLVALIAVLGMGGLAVGALRGLAVMAAFQAAAFPAGASPAGALSVDNSPETASLPGADGREPGDPAPPPVWKMQETRLQAALLGLGGLALVLAGIFPQSYLPALTSMAIIFAGGGP